MGFIRFTVQLIACSAQAGNVDLLAIYSYSQKHAEVVEWYTRTTQNRVSFALVGSSPTFGTVNHMRFTALHLL